MKIIVSQISELEGLRIEHIYPEGEPRLRGEEGRILGRPSLSVSVSREGAEVRMIGKVGASVEVFCDRCLAPISISVDEVFDLLYLPPLKLEQEEEIELAEDDLRVGFYQGDEVDLDDLVREQIELALPIRRLCREDCRGLCPQCGTNLNEAECFCQAEVLDPRWEALKKF
jgi:uncharacterized protein